MSLDWDRGGPERLSLHLSISHLLGLGLPSRPEASFLLSLYYAPDELGLLRCAEGTQWPLFHYWLPWPMVDNAGA